MGAQCHNFAISGRSQLFLNHHISFGTYVDCIIWSHIGKIAINFLTVVTTTKKRDTERFFDIYIEDSGLNIVD